MKSLRLCWFGHINRMQEQRLVKSMYKWKTITSRRWIRQKGRLKDYVLVDLKIMKINNWMNSVQNRIEWKRVVEVKILTEEMWNLLKKKKQKKLSAFLKKGGLNKRNILRCRFR